MHIEITVLRRGRLHVFDHYTELNDLDPEFLATGVAVGYAARLWERNDGTTLHRVEVVSINGQNRITSIHGDMIPLEAPDRDSYNYGMILARVDEVRDEARQYEVRLGLATN